MLVSPNLLSRYSPMISETRHQFIELIGQLPPALSDIALQRISDRTSRAGGRPLLGEYAPWLIADLLEIHDVPAVRQITLSWLHVYFFVLMVDDLVDRPPDRLDPSDFIIGSFLFQKGLLRLARHGIYEEGLDAAFLDTAVAALREISAWHHRIQGLASPDPTLVGQKLALLRVCCRSLVPLAVGRHNPTAALDIFLDHLGIGIQLLDDVTDLEEDFCGGRLSHPLRLAVQRYPSLSAHTVPASFNRDTLLLLVESGALADTLSAALQSFRNTIEAAWAINSSQDNTAGAYVRALAEATSAALSAVLLAQSRLAGTRVADTEFATPRAFAEKRQQIACDVTNALETVAQTS